LLFDEAVWPQDCFNSPNIFRYAICKGLLILNREGSNMAVHDYPLSEVPQSDRKGLLSTSIVLLGFTFFTATMWAGGTLGKAFAFDDLLTAIVIGNLVLGVYASLLAYIACKSGLNSVLMGRFCFGELGSKLSDFILGFTQIGWYAWGTATIAIVLIKATSLSEAADAIYGMVEERSVSR
jgi:cytosine permease